MCPRSSSSDSLNMMIIIELCVALAAFNIYHEWKCTSSMTVASSLPSKNITDYDLLYETFRQESLSEGARTKWLSGSPCDHGSDASKVTYCPMPFEPSTFTSCCEREPENVRRCCEREKTKSVLSKWGIGIGVVSAGVLFAVAVMCFFNKCTKWFSDTQSDDTPRPKLKVTVITKQSVKPVDKRTLLKTGNYTVEQSWDQITVKFYNREFYENFRDSLLRKYKHLNWRDVRLAQEGDVQNAVGEEVGLTMRDDTRLLRITKSGNTSWVMNDFQNVCKCVSVGSGQDVSELRQPESSLAANACLSPRLPTIGEEFFDAGDYHVKISQTEVEIKFTKEASFNKFKRMLLYRYPTLPWSKYLQRDCAQIRLESGKNVNLHLWEAIRSVWVSGDGKKDWYNKEFQELYADAVYGHIQGDTISLNRPSSGTSTSGRLSRTSGRNPSSVEIPAMYTVKNLESGDIEVEFASSAFLREMRCAIENSRLGLGKDGGVKWAGHVTKVKTDSGKIVVIQMGKQIEQSRKMWIYNDPACREWFNKQFKRLYTSVYENIHAKDSQSRHSSEFDETIVPVEHTA